jgi:hypothetical protein
MDFMAEGMGLTSSKGGNLPGGSRVFREIGSGRALIG